MQKYQDVVLKPNGDVVANAAVLVQTYPGGTTASIFSNDGVTVASNPIITDSLGGYYFYAANGSYQLVISGSGITQRTVTDVQLFDPQDAGASGDISYSPTGTGAVTRTVQTKLRETVSDSDYSSFANALAQANSALIPLLATPTTDAGLSGAYLKKGWLSGHCAIGNGMTAINAFAGIQGDEFYLNVDQEARGVSYVVRNTRTTADEPTLGWDFFGVTGVVVVEAGNTQYIRGNQKAVVGELYFKPPTTGSYSVKKSHNFQANIVELGVNVTLEDWYGYVVNTPAVGGTITNGYGVYILPMTGISNAAAIKIDGTANAGQIRWTNTRITELAIGKLEIDLGSTMISEDSSNRLNIDLNTQQLILTNALVATSVGAAGGASALPATPQGYWRVNIGGVTRKIPYYTD